MKTCQPCGTVSDAATCPHCGEASWFENGHPLASASPIAVRLLIPDDTEPSPVPALIPSAPPVAADKRGSNRRPR